MKIISYCLVLFSFNLNCAANNENSTTVLSTVVNPPKKSETKKILFIVNQQMRTSFTSNYNAPELYQRLESALTILDNTVESMTTNDDYTIFTKCFIKEVLSPKTMLRRKTYKLERIVLQIQRLRDATWYIKGKTVSAKDANNFRMEELSLGELADLKLETFEGDNRYATYARKVARAPLQYGITRKREQEMIYGLMIEIQKHKTEVYISSESDESDDDSSSEIVSTSLKRVWCPTLY